MMGDKEVIIYMPLLNEGVDVSRPVKALALGNEQYKILPLGEHGSEHEDEEWKFLPGSIVRAEMRKYHDASLLTAVELISPPGAK